VFCLFDSLFVDVLSSVVEIRITSPHCSRDEYMLFILQDDLKAKFEISSVSCVSVRILKTVSGLNSISYDPIANCGVFVFR
jgi:hypothetical protein